MCGPPLEGAASVLCGDITTETPTPSSPMLLTTVRRDAKLLRRARAVAAVALPLLLATEPLDGDPPAAVPAVPLGILLAGVLLLINLFDPSMDPDAPDDVLKRRAAIEIGLDSLVMGAVVWLVALDPTSSLWVLLLLPVLEGALRFQLTGAIAAMAGNGLLYLARDIYVGSTNPDAIVDFSTGVQRVGLLAVVGLAAGSLASRLVHEASRHSVMYAEADRRSEILNIVAYASADMTSLDLRQVRQAIHDALSKLGLRGRIVGPSANESSVRPASAEDSDWSFPILANTQLRGHIVTEEPVPAEMRGALELLASHAGICLAQAEIFAETELLRVRLQHQAFHYPLTGLPNRAAFDADLREQAERRRPPGEGMAVLFIDLDGFKGVNDRLGHEAGDRLLEATARRLQGCLRPEDHVARLGGDEFTVLLDGTPDIDSAMIVARRVLEVLDQPFVIDGRAVRVSGSIGVAFSCEAVSDPDQLVRNADQAMYQAKQSGRGRIVVHRSVIDLRDEPPLSQPFHGAQAVPRV
jgi:diguanylate cyclase (GGDEF)-like protein